MTNTCYAKLPLRCTKHHLWKKWHLYPNAIEEQIKPNKVALTSNKCCLHGYWEFNECRIATVHQWQQMFKPSGNLKTSRTRWSNHVDRINYNLQNVDLLFNGRLERSNFYRVYRANRISIAWGNIATIRWKTETDTQKWLEEGEKSFILQKTIYRKPATRVTLALLTIEYLITTLTLIKQSGNRCSI